MTHSTDSNRSSVCKRPYWFFAGY